MWREGKGRAGDVVYPLKRLQETWSLKCNRILYETDILADTDTKMGPYKNL
jgi:hypothetical protein